MKDSTARMVAAVGSLGTLYLIFFMVASPVVRVILLMPFMMMGAIGSIVMFWHRRHLVRQ